MTSLAIRQEAIEDALIALFSGISITVEGVPTPVQVFMEEPAVEQTIERAYPSITLMYIGESPDLVIRESDQENQEEEVAFNDTLPVYERTMRENPEAQTLLYSIDTWNKARAQSSRDILFEAIRNKVKARGYLTVLNVDGENVDLSMDKAGGVVPLHERHPDTVIYHFSSTVAISAFMAVVDNSDTRDEKVAMNVQWNVFSTKPDGTDDGELDLTIQISENDAEPI